MEPRREGSKLRLKRKKQLEEDNQENLLSRPLANGSNLTWFQKQDLSKAESTWMRLLRAVDPTLTCSSLENVARLPPFQVPQRIQIADSQPKSEPFSVGMRVFQWVPFPVYCRESPDLRNHRIKDSKSHGYETISIKGKEENEDVNPKVSSWVLDQKTFDQAEEGMRMQQSMKPSSKLDGGERTGTSRPIWPQNPAGPSSSTPPHHHEDSFDGQWLSDGSAAPEKRRSEKEPLQKNDGLAPIVLPSSANEQDKEKKQSQEPSVFDQCPMCQMHFSGTWSKLDLDSHLAKCLSESADDVVW